MFTTYCYVQQDSTWPQNNNWQKLAYFTNWTKIEINFCWTSNFGIQKKQKNLRDIIAIDKVFDNKQILNVKKINKGICQLRFTRSVNLCCIQLKTFSTFQSAFNRNTFLIRHNVTCESSYVIYLMEYCFAKNHNMLKNPNTA